MDAGKPLILTLLLVSYLASYTNGATYSCERIKNYNGEFQDCTCQYMKDKEPAGIISLYEIAKTGKALFLDQSTNDVSRDKAKYSYNPCKPFTEKDCHNTSICQIPSPILYYPVGFQNTTQYAVAADGNITFTYSAGTRTGIVTLICDPSVTVPALLTVGEFPDNKEHYFFYLTHKCACPGSCVPPGLGGLSDGSILLIVFFVVVFVYFVGGMVFLKFVRHEEGTDIIPNRSFWGSLPGLIKDGMVYFFSILFCRRDSYERF